MTRRPFSVSVWITALPVAVLGLVASTTSTREETVRVIRSDADYDKIDHTKPPDPRQVQKLVGYILEGMRHARSADGQAQHLGRNRVIDHYMNRFLDRQFGRGRR
jgi:hypothetical protein